MRLDHLILPDGRSFIVSPGVPDARVEVVKTDGIDGSDIRRAIKSFEKKFAPKPPTGVSS